MLECYRGKLLYKTPKTKEQGWRDLCSALFDVFIGYDLNKPTLDEDFEVEISDRLILISPKDPEATWSRWIQLEKVEHNAIITILEKKNDGKVVEEMQCAIDTEYGDIDDLFQFLCDVISSDLEGDMEEYPRQLSHESHISIWRNDPDEFQILEFGGISSEVSIQTLGDA